MTSEAAYGFGSTARLQQAHRRRSACESVAESAVEAVCLAGKPILVDPTVFHDHAKRAVWCGDQAQVLQRTAVDEQQVGQRALLDNAEFAWLGVAPSGHGQQFSID